MKKGSNFENHIKHVLNLMLMLDLIWYFRCQVCSSDDIRAVSGGEGASRNLGPMKVEEKENLLT